MDKFAKLVGRQYSLFDYVGAPDAEHVIIIMGSGAEAVHETVDYLTAQGKKVGVLKVRLYPAVLRRALPASAAANRKEHRRSRPHQGTGRDRRAALPGRGHRADRRVHRRQSSDGQLPQGDRRTLRPVVEGIHARDGQAHLRRADEARRRRTTSPSASTTTSPTPAWTTTPTFSTEPPETVRAMFYGLGADGTVGANKNTIKIIGEETDLNVQGYFVYDSKKSGAVTTSHLRFSKQADSLDLPDLARELRRLPPVQLHGAARRAEERRTRRGLPAEQPVRPRRGLGQPAALSAGHDHREEAEVLRHRRGRSGAQTPAWAAASTPSCRPASSPSAACCRAKKPSPPSSTAIEKTYGKRGESVVRKNFAAVDAALEHLHEVKVPQTRHVAASTCGRRFRRTLPSSCATSKR